MSKALEITNTRGVVPQGVSEMMEMATMFANAGPLVPKDFKTPQAIFVAMQHGMELGLSPAQSLQSIAVINGRPCIWGDAALALCVAHPDFEDIDETFIRDEVDKDKTRARCEVKRKGRTPVVREFSIGDAKLASLWGKSGPWSSYPKRMLQMRARSYAIRDAFPDALKGVGVVEEMREAKPIQARVIKSTAILPGEQPEVPQLTDAAERSEPIIPADDVAEDPTATADHDLF